MAERFNQGDPLDINLLNDMLDKVNKAEATTTAISGQTSGIQNNLRSGFVVAEGGLESISISQGLGSKSITLVNIKKEELLTIVGSLSSVLDKATDSGISVSVHGSYPNYRLYAATGKTFSGNVNIRWLAVGLRSLD